MCYASEAIKNKRFIDLIKKASQLFKVCKNYFDFVPTDLPSLHVDTPLFMQMLQCYCKSLNALRFVSNDIATKGIIITSNIIVSITQRNTNCVG